MIDVVILGGGHMGALHARVFALASPETARVIGVFDVDAVAAARLAAARGIKVFSTLTEAVFAADLTVVATPIDSHRALAQEALFAGGAVLVEKPVCGTLADVVALERAHLRSGAPVFVGHSERFNPVIVAMRSLVRGQRVRRISLERLGPRSRHAEHGVAVNLAVHDLDLASIFLDGTMLVHSARGERDEIEIELTGGTGSAHLHASQRATTRTRQIVLDLDDRTYEADLLDLTLTGTDGPLAVPHEEPLVLQARAILDALEGRPSTAARLEDGATAVRAALAAERLREAGLRALAR
ncbi:Gfo/Idh/MocA family oxidoreductase [soil metagenome]